MNSPLPQRDYFTVKEIAARLDMCERWVYEQIRQCTGIPFRRNGHKIQIPKDDFLEWNRQRIVR